MTVAITGEAQYCLATKSYCRKALSSLIHITSVEATS